MVIKVAAVLLALTMGRVAALAGQEGTTGGYVPTMTFDVISVRQSAEANSYRVSGGFSPHSTTLRIENFDLENLLAMAYGTRRDEVEGLPEWRAMFNVEAKGNSDEDARLKKLDGAQEWLEQQHMVQGLLAERFALKAHWEVREGPVKRLVIAKGGSRLRAGGRAVSEEERKVFGAEPVPALYQRGSSMTGFELVGHGCTLDSLAKMLSGQFGRPVLDQTGLEGKYDFVVKYHGTLLSERNADDLDPVPTLDVAIQEQLGLKVEEGRGARRTLVVDHVAMPTAN